MAEGFNEIWDEVGHQQIEEEIICLNNTAKFVLLSVQRKLSFELEKDE